MVGSNKKRVDFIDVAKGITIILVVVSHICEVKYLSPAILSYHMAFFFIISGYFFNPNKYDFKKDFFNYMIPFFIVCFLVAIYKLIFEGFDSFLLKLYAIIYGSGYDFLDKPFLIVGVGGVWFLSSLAISRFLLKIYFCYMAKIHF